MAADNPITYRAGPARLIFCSLGGCLASAAVVALERRVINWPLFSVWLIAVLGCHVSAIRLMNWSRPPDPAVECGKAEKIGSEGGRFQVDRSLVRVLWPLLLSLALGLGLAWTGHRAALWMTLAGAVAAVALPLNPLKNGSFLLAGPISFLVLGPALTGAGHYLLTGRLSPIALAVGLPMGLMAAADAWTEDLVHWPLARRDGLAREWVWAGLTWTVWIYFFLLSAGLAALVWLAFVQNQGWLMILGLAPTPLYLSALVIVLRHPWARGQIARARLKAATATAWLVVILASSLGLEWLVRG